MNKHRGFATLVDAASLAVRCELGGPTSSCTTWRPKFVRSFWGAVPHLLVKIDRVLSALNRISIGCKGPEILQLQNRFEVFRRGRVCHFVQKFLI